jgi:hypothetical protein
MNDIICKIEEAIETISDIRINLSADGNSLFSVLTPGAGIAAVGAGLDVDVTGIPEPVDSVRLHKILTPGVHPHIIANVNNVRVMLCVV